MIGNVAEGPGGFLHALMDYRKVQHNNYSWNKDCYHAITLKIYEDHGVQALDWHEKRAKEFFYNSMFKHRIQLSYGEDGSGNMFKIQNLDYYIQ